MKHIKVIRFSFHGFKPQFQAYHKKSMDWYLNLTIRDFLESYKDYSRYQKKITWQRIQKHREFVKEHYLNNLYGVWVFIDGYVVKQSLNHLKTRVPSWSAELPADSICYDLQNDWIGHLSDDRAKHFGVFIPATQLNRIKNIKRIRKTLNK